MAAKRHDILVKVLVLECIIFLILSHMYAFFIGVESQIKAITGRSEDIAVTGVQVFILLSVISFLFLIVTGLINHKRIIVS